ncbi:MAG: hypothetical protein GY862_28255 [Gammaproteobacteria bacterium]|nr:hypothetical protein [Gammaproteobacteria bacterium]
MSQITWLHLSDWHQQGPDFNRQVVRDALIREIEERPQTVDFIVFSGDVAQSGKEAEYRAAWENLFDPLLEAADLTPEQLIIVPGNHDLDRDEFEFLPQATRQAFTDEKKVQTWLTQEKRREHLLAPFAAYRRFVTEYLGRDRSAYADITRFEAGGKKIALLGLNSAWMCNRNKNADGKINDRGFLAIGEPQIHDALHQISDADLRIAVLHHPFDWLAEFDRNRVEERIRRECDFILYGHRHVSQVEISSGTAGDCVIIPAGTCYDQRTAANPRYTNAYNFVRLDFETVQTTVCLRRWNDGQNKWLADTDAHTDGELTFPFPKSMASEPSPARPAKTAPAAPARDKQLIKNYLKSLIRQHEDLEPGGIKQTKLQVVLPLDEIYVSLRAGRDRPDVDRRVMREELDDIKRRLEQVEDPSEREKQYQLWAIHARILEAGPDASRDMLHDIIQRHRQSVILGDPGSGKTTLVRYLTLCFAREILNNIDRLFAPQTFWQQDEAWLLPDLGPVRLPILLRVAKYADARNPETGGNPDLALPAYMPSYFAGLNVPDAQELGPLFRRLLEAGRCLVLFDGLDEITNEKDRRNIAAAINRFAGSYGEAGLPEWLNRWLQPSASEHWETEQDPDISWDEEVPAAERRQWGKHVRQLLQQHGHGVRAYQLLDEKKYHHVGNRIVVTSRIAGYHFAPLGGEFEHFTIQRMELAQIETFLNKWCPAVEQHTTKNPDPAKIRDRAQRETDGILQAIRNTPGVRRMAENPLLLRILAIVHRNEAHLPQRRVELYETAAITLIRDWNLQRELRISVDEKEAMNLLGPVALWTHENRAGGLITKGEAEEILGLIMAHRRGLFDRGEMDRRLQALAAGQRLTGSGDDLPQEIETAVGDFLRKIREHTGLYVERGEGLYGFMHLTFEEYFAARQLVSRSTDACAQILARLHQPRWREPILLAVASLSNQFYDDTDALLQAVLDHPDPYEPVLHRNLLFVAACVGDSPNIYPSRRKDIAQKLLTLYVDGKGAGRYRRLRQQIKILLEILNNELGDESVEEALLETLQACSERPALTAFLEAVAWLEARSPALLKALENRSELAVLPDAHQVLYEVRQRVARATGGDQPAGWEAYQRDSAVARLLGGLFYHWNQFLPISLGLPENTVNKANKALVPWRIYIQIRRARQVLARLAESPEKKQDGEFWWCILDELFAIFEQLPETSSLNTAIVECARDLHALTHNLSEEVADFSWELNYMLQNSGISSFPRANSLELAIQSFRNALDEETIRTTPLENVLEQAGRIILEGISVGQTLAPLFAQTARHFLSGKPPFNNETLPDILEQAGKALLSKLSDSLRKAGEPLPYQEAALLLLFPNESLAETLSLLFADLAVENSPRQLWALAVLSKRIACSPQLEFTPEQHVLLTGLLDGQPDRTVIALDILLLQGLKAELLAWCWKILRDVRHPLRDTASEKLNAIRKISGDLSSLSLLDEALQDGTLRPYGLELLRKVEWQSNADILLLVLQWLTIDDIQVQQLAGLLISPPDEDEVEDEVEKRLETLSELLRNAASEYTKKSAKPDTKLITRIADGSDEQSPGTLETAAFLPPRQLKALLQNTNKQTPFTVWLQEKLSPHGLDITRLSAMVNLRKLLGLLENDEETRLVALFALNAFDLDLLLVSILLEAVQSADDRIRVKAEKRLYTICRQLPTDKSTAAIDHLVEKYLEAKDKKDGYLITLFANTGHNFDYRHSAQIEYWLEIAAQGKHPQHKVACQGLDFFANKLSEENIRLFAGILSRPASAVIIHILATKTLKETLKHRENKRNNHVICNALLQTLVNQETEVRKCAAYGLQWIVEKPAWKTVQGLLARVQEDPDENVRLLALRSLGRVLQTVQGYCDIDLSKEALFGKDGWLHSQGFAVNEILLNEILESRTMQEESDVTTLLESLSRLKMPEVTQETRTRLRESAEWQNLLDTARKEWERRQYWANAAPELRDGIATIERLMHSPDTDTRNIAACALARIHQGKEERIEYLHALLQDDVMVLQALLDAAVDRDGDWPAYKAETAKQITRWLEQKPQEIRNRLVNWMLDDLKPRLEIMLNNTEREEDDEDNLVGLGNPYTGWPYREIVLATLAELSETFTCRLFANRYLLDEVVSLFAQAARDPDSYISRQFAIRALGNLQLFTTEVADVFFDACRDYDAVYQETRAAVGKFKKFAPGSLEKLTRALGHESITVAYHAALLLGELGVSRSEELGPETRARVAGELMKILENPLVAQRIVHDFSEGSEKRIGPLYDVIYDTLLRVVSGTDSV